MAKNKKNVLGFKKFSDMKKDKVQEVDLGLTSKDSDDLPMNPNLHKKTNKIEKPASTKSFKPVNDKETDVTKNDDSSADSSNENVKTIGKVAKFPKNVKASKAYNFLENVKVSKKSIWYIMVEKQDNELQMVKYNYREGVDLNKFVNELKTYYLNKYEGNNKICESIKKIKVDGSDKYSMVKNIPLIELEGKKMITTITEDLIKLLSK